MTKRDELNLRPLGGSTNPFVRRLIPTVAAAALTITACTKPKSKLVNNGNGPGAPGFVDGNVTNQDLERFCQAWSECSAEYFQYSFSSVSDCVTQNRQYIDEYEEYYGAECANIMEALLACRFADATCVQGGLEVPDATEQKCAEQLGQAYEMVCNDSYEG